MKLIFVGPQGSGKGTQAKRIARKLGLCHISSGDLLRGCKGEVKVEVDKFMSKGELIPDELMVKVLRQRLSKGVCETGFILDGFPRNLAQVEMLKGITDIDKVIEIAISDEEAVKRICGRRNCRKCGAIYNVSTSPRPSVEGVCDKCGGELFARKDDNEEALKERLKIYHEETEKILKMYPFMRVNGSNSIEKVEEDIVEGVGASS